MPASNSTMIHRLQQAINQKYNQKILYQTKQFYSDQDDRPVTKYCIKKAVPDESTGKNRNIDLFSSYSQIQIVLYLRDMWYTLNGWEVPTDNQMWNEIKEKIKAEKEKEDRGGE